MNWSSVENLVHDNYSLLEKEQVLSVSEQLLSSVDDATKPLQAARITYLLILLELKNKEMVEDKALLYLDNLNKILKHEAQETEISQHEHAEAHLRYVLKLADQYLHHIAVLAEIMDAERITKRAQRLRKHNHEQLMLVQHPAEGFWRKEQALIKRAIRKHYLFMGFLFALSLFFAWNSLWNLADVAIAEWVLQINRDQDLSQIVQNSLLLTFSLCYIAAFTRYQRESDDQMIGAPQIAEEALLSP